MDFFGWLRKPGGQQAGRSGTAGNGGASPGGPPLGPTHAPALGTPASRELRSLPAPFRPEPTASPDEIRRLLFDAVAAGDERRLESLCHEHKEFVSTHLNGWLEVPAAFRTSPEVYEWYRDGLRAIARFCGERIAAPVTPDSFGDSSAKQL